MLETFTGRTMIRLLYWPMVLWPEEVSVPLTQITNEHTLIFLEYNSKSFIATILYV